MVGNQQSNSQLRKYQQKATMHGTGRRRRTWDPRLAGVHSVPSDGDEGHADACKRNVANGVDGGIREDSTQR